MDRKLLKRFARDERGTAYIITGFALLPLLGMTALAIDYTNAVRIETQINTAAQSVALHLAKRTTMNPSIAATELVDEGKGLMAQMVPGRELVYERFFVDPLDGMVQIVAKTEVDTHLMHLFGHETLVVGGRKQAQFGRRDVEVAIAIDNSGSMGRWSGGKRMIDAAKDATKVLMDSASAAMSDFDNANLRFSLVPWHTNVVVPEEYRTDSLGNDAWWIDWEGRSTGHFNYLAPYGNDGDMYYEMPRNGSQTSDEWRYYVPERLIDYLPLEPDGDGIDINALRNEPGINIITRRDVFDRFTNVEWAGCFEHRHGDYQFSFDEPNTQDGDSLFVPHMAPDERDWRWGHNSYIYDRGGDTPGNNGMTNGNNWRRELQTMANTPKYAGSPGWMNTNYHSGSTNWFGPNGKCNTAPLIAMSDDRLAIEQAVDGMQANGNTDLTIGLEWAMHTLTPWEPLDQAHDFGKAEKILVFMTDGDNVPVRPSEYRTSYSSFQYTKDDMTNYGLPERPNSTQARRAFDEASKRYCTEIKNMGVRIYFVYFGNPSSAATDIMNHCASSSETAIAASNSQELEDAFRKIGDDIGKLRLTHYTPPAP